MFSSLGEKLTAILTQLRRRGSLTERDLDEGLRAVRLALLEADVNYKVVGAFVERIKAQALGTNILESLTPGQQVVKIVRDELARLLGGQAAALNLSARPSVLLMVGLQGSGKTTSSAKLARHLGRQGQRRVLLVATDVRRPAAIEQLQQLGAALKLPVFAPQTAQRGAVEIARGAVAEAERVSYDVVIIDTAGRLQIDETLMDELVEMKQAVQPAEILLVADAMTGQEAVNIATAFHQRLGLTGILLTKLDGDARGGAALSMVEVVGRPIKYVGVGEKTDDLEVFHPDRMAERILGMGDMLSLIEEVEKKIDQQKAQELARKVQSERFTLEDFRDQLGQLKKLGPLNKILEKMPGLGKIAPAQINEREFVKVQAIIDSMTVQERRRPDVLDARRKRRVARGSGTQVSDVNRLLKRFDEAKKLMKQLQRRMPLGNLPF